MDSKTMASNSSSNIGMLVVLSKLGPKIFPIMMKVAKVIPKVFKGLLGIKTVGVVASVGLYSYLMTWQMGVALTAFVFVHEYGHLWAMKKCGLKTKGIYLIPGFGGAAIAAEGFRSCRNEAFIALMGPLVGLFFIVPMLGAYFYTGNLMFAAIASIMALINLINLFPINPLDGGRVVKSLLYSFHGAVGFYFSFISFFVALFFSNVFGMELLSYIAFIGILEIFSDYGLWASMRKFGFTFFRLILGYFIFVLISSETSDTFYIFCKYFISIILLIALLWQLAGQTIKERENILYMPFVLIMDFFVGIREFFSIGPSSLRRVDGMETMSRRLISGYSLLYVITILLMVGLIWYCDRLPGCELAKEMLK